MGISSQWKRVMALAALVSGSQAQARSYRQGEGGVVDGSKGESLSITLNGGGDPHLLLDLVGAISVNATYTIALTLEQQAEPGEEIYVTYRRGGVVASNGSFGPGPEQQGLMPRFINSVETRVLTDADKSAYGLSRFSPSLDGKEGFRIRAQSLAGTGHSEVFTITPKSRNKLFFYIQDLNVNASVVVVAGA